MKLAFVYIGRFTIVNNLMFRRILKICFFVFHFFVVIVVCLFTTLQSYQKYYDIKESLVTQNLNSILNSNIIFPYTQLTGTETGYGFFAPNVASQLVTEFITKRPTNEIASIDYSPPFESYESSIRYVSAVSFYLDEIQKNEKRDEYANYRLAIIRCIERNFLNDRENVNAVSVKIFIYEFPSLLQYNSKLTKPILLPIFHDEIKKK